MIDRGGVVYQSVGKPPQPVDGAMHVIETIVQQDLSLRIKDRSERGIPGSAVVVRDQTKEKLIRHCVMPAISANHTIRPSV